MSWVDDIKGVLLRGTGLSSYSFARRLLLGSGLEVSSYDELTRTATLISNSGGQWHTLFDTDFATVTPVTFDHDGQYILSDGSIWYKAGTAGDSYSPQIIAASSVRWWPTNSHDIRVGNGTTPCLYTLNADLGLSLPPETPFRLEVMRTADAGNPTGNWLSADALLEVSPPAGLEPQRQCNWIQASVSGSANPAPYLNWTGGNRHNNGSVASYWSENVASGMVALDCAQLTMIRGAAPGHVIHGIGASVAGDWPADGAWVNRLIGDDWSAALSFSNTFTDGLTRGSFGGWGICIGALRGFASAAADCYIGHRRIRLRAYY